MCYNMNTESTVHYNLFQELTLLSTTCIEFRCETSYDRIVIFVERICGHSEKCCQKLLE